jgi:hypothetical protein
MSGVRSKCINNMAHLPRTCWHPRCQSAKLSRNCYMSAWLAVLAQPTAPASTYEECTPSRQPTELGTPPLAARAERLQKHHDTQGHARRQHGPAAARSHRGELPRALTPAHGQSAARTHPHTHHRRWIGWLGSILSLFSLFHGLSNGFVKGCGKKCSIDVGEIHLIIKLTLIVQKDGMQNIGSPRPTALGAWMLAVQCMDACRASIHSQRHTVSSRTVSKEFSCFLCVKSGLPGLLVSADPRKLLAVAHEFRRVCRHMFFGALPGEFSVHAFLKSTSSDLGGGGEVQADGLGGSDGRW